MNKQEIQNQIKALEKKLETLNLKFNECDKSVKRWRAEINENYYSIDVWVNICLFKETNAKKDNFCYSIGNYFKTYKEAEKYKENLLLKQQLKDIALELNNGVEIDWKGSDRKHYIYFDYDEDELNQEWCSSYRDLGVIYCLSDKFFEVAIKRIGEEKLKQLLESGV